MREIKQKRRGLWGVILVLCIAFVAGVRGSEYAHAPKETDQYVQQKQEKGPGKIVISKADWRKKETWTSCLGKTGIQEMEAGSVLEVSGLEPEVVNSLFYSEEISQEVLGRIEGESYHANDQISLEELRYLRILHLGFDGKTHIGELIVNREIAADILAIMEQLYRENYPIERMVLVDEYGGEDEASMEDNNTSAFNYREIAGSSRLSKHSMGLAIDINPRYNPCVRGQADGMPQIEPQNGAEYADRSQAFAHKIEPGDLCYQLFTEYGFTWGGSWNTLKDYQHFEKKL